MSFGCSTCSGECCRRYLVHVSGRDAVTIARAQQIGLESFIDIVSEEAGSGRGFLLDNDDDMYALTLRRRDDGACTFLVGLMDGSQRCGIYPSRPFTCSVFPLRLFHGSVDIRDDVICEPSGKRITAVDLPSGRALLLRAAFEWSVYAHIVAAWNNLRLAKPGRVDERAFFAYLDTAYDAIDGMCAVRQPAIAGTIDHWMEGAPSDDAARDRLAFERELDALLTSIA